MMLLLPVPSISNIYFLKKRLNSKGTSHKKKLLWNRVVWKSQASCALKVFSKCLDSKISKRNEDFVIHRWLAENHLEERNQKQ